MGSAMANIVMQPCDSGVVRWGTAASPCAKSSQPYVLAVTILGSSMVFIDGTVVNVALPALQADMDASVADVQWVVESYALLLAALLLVGGALGDKHGRKRVFSAGVALFALASVWCGLAPDIEQLIVARAAQGLGGALLVPGSLAIIGASFSAEERGRAIGTWSAYTAITSALGPVLGGWLIEQISWRAVFLLNAPLAVIVIALAWRYVPESRDDTPGVGLDWGGAALATVGLGATVYGLIEAPRLGISDPRVLGALAGGAAASVAFFLVEAQVRNPMVPLALFRARDFSGANLLTLLLYTALSGGLFFFPLNLIQVQGYSTTAAGAATLPFVLIMFFLSRWSGGLVARYGARLPLVVGPAIAAIGFALFIPPGVGGELLGDVLSGGGGPGHRNGRQCRPLTTTVMNAVGERRSANRRGRSSPNDRAALAGSWRCSDQVIGRGSRCCPTSGSIVISGAASNQVRPFSSRQLSSGKVEHTAHRAQGEIDRLGRAPGLQPSFNERSQRLVVHLVEIQVTNVGHHTGEQLPHVVDRH